MSHLGVRRDAVLAMSLLLGLALPALAQEKPITIETSTMQPSVVLGRPMLTWWDVKIPGSNLMVGKFRFVLKSEGYQFATVETEELTMNGPEQRIRVMLPGVDSPLWIDRLYVDISFEGKNFSGSLGQQILRVPFASRTVFLGLAGESRLVRKRSPQRENILEALRFEQHVPGFVSRTEDDNDPEYVKTIFASIDPADFPADALGYCGYDVVILMKDEFRNLRKAQLEGLLAWIKAGGSLYVEPNGVLEGYHVDFLKSLTADDPYPYAIHLDAFGKLPPETVPLDRDVSAVKCGLGDAVLRTADPDSPIDWSSSQTKKHLGALWKVRREIPEPHSVHEMTEIAPGQFVNFPVNKLDPYGFSTAHMNRMTARPDQLLDRLMPEDVRMVPFSLLAAILVALVVLIGPVDYIGLGWLRARKWTWITFPAAILGVTGLTVLISNAYMTGAETRHSLVIRDMDQKGAVVRTNRFELLFMAATKTVQTNIEKGTFAKLETGTLDHQTAAAGFMSGGGQFANSRGWTPYPTLGKIRGRTSPQGDGQASTSVSTEIEGRMPGQYTASQNLSKWTPQINRIMSIPGSAGDPEVDWTEWDLYRSEIDSIRHHNLPPQLINLAKTRFGPNAMVACFTGKDGWAYDRGQGWRSMRALNYRYPSVSVTLLPPVTRAAGEADLFRWLDAATVPLLDQGAFAIAKQKAPKGGAVCDDLPLLDVSDSDTWLLVVVVPEENDLIVYRKLMRFR